MQTDATTSSWDTAFLETTRGQIVQILRRGPRTVIELSHELGLAANTVRTHLSNLDRTGMVQQVGTRRGTGAGKPAHVYRLTIETESKFSEAYVPVLRTLVETLTERMSPADFEALMDEVGVRLAPNPQAEAGTAQQVLIASEIIEGLGGTIVTAQANGSVKIEGAGCPLGAVVAHQPRMCAAVRSLLSTALGVEMRTLCSHGERPTCRFQSI